MEKAVKIGGQDIKVRGLKWKEKQQLKADGFNISILNPYGDNDELVVKVIGVVCEDTSFLDDPELDTADVYEIFKEIQRLTFSIKDVEKN